MLYVQETVSHSPKFSVERNNVLQKLKTSVNWKMEPIKQDYQFCDSRIFSFPTRYRISIYLPSVFEYFIFENKMSPMTGITNKFDGWVCLWALHEWEHWKNSIAMKQMKKNNHWNLSK